MQGPPPPTEGDEAYISTEHDVRNGQPAPFLSAGSRKAAKRTFPFDLKARETIQIALPQPPPPPPRAEEIKAAKRRRHEKSLPALADETDT
jgi:hypothetical protein